MARAILAVVALPGSAAGVLLPGLRRRTLRRNIYIKD